MAETKWTKGPWVLDDTGCIAVDDGSKWPTKYIKCTSPWIEGVFKDDAEMLANQRLMAAAPELYERLEDAKVTLEEAAKLLAQEFPSLANNIVNQCAIRCGDLLAKARGDG